MYRKLDYIAYELFLDYALSSCDGLRYDYTIHSFMHSEKDIHKKYYDKASKILRIEKLNRICKNQQI